MPPRATTWLLLATTAAALAPGQPPAPASPLAPPDDDKALALWLLDPARTTAEVLDGADALASRPPTVLPPHDRDVSGWVLTEHSWDLAIWVPRHWPVYVYKEPGNAEPPSPGNAAPSWSGQPNHYDAAAPRRARGLSA